MCIFGSTGSGKSQLTRRILLESDEIYDQGVDKILYCYSEYQSLFQKMEHEMNNISFHLGVPSREFIEEFTSSGSHNIVVLDDLCHKVIGSDDMLQLFCVTSHHKNLSVIFLTQNVFSSGKHARTIALQSHYLVALKSLRDQSQLSYISRQIYPGVKCKFIPEVFADVMKMDKYAYLVMDLAPHSDDRFRLRSHIFKGEDMIFYTPKS